MQPHEIQPDPVEEASLESFPASTRSSCRSKIDSMLLKEQALCLQARRAAASTRSHEYFLLSRINTALDFISQGDAYVFNRPGDLWTLSATML